MGSYLADVKSQLKGVFDEAFEFCWKDVVEPALKQSYKNGFEAGKAGKEPAAGNDSTTPRRQWGRKRTPASAPQEG